MRDTFKDKEYFTKFISENIISLNQSLSFLTNGKVHPNRINHFEYHTLEIILKILIAKYSCGFPINKLNDDYDKILDFLPKVFHQNVTKIKDKGGICKDQYRVEPHGVMLRLLSLGYLLNVSEQKFNKLVETIDRDNISDNLYEFIIKAKFPNRSKRRPEEYDENHSVILKVYKNLRLAIKEQDKDIASQLILDFLKKDFNHRHSGFYNSHKKDFFYGYWSFESVVIVKILDLDKNVFKNNKYFPTDF